MADKGTETDDVDAIVERFGALTFEQKQSTLKRLQGVLAGEVTAARKKLLDELAALDAIAAPPVASAPQNAGARRARVPRSDAPARYQSKKDPNLTTPGTGRPPQWLTEEMAETGLPKEAFLIDAK